MIGVFAFAVMSCANSPDASANMIKSSAASKLPAFERYLSTVMLPFSGTRSEPKYRTEFSLKRGEN